MRKDVQSSFYFTKSITFVNSNSSYHLGFTWNYIIGIYFHWHIPISRYLDIISSTGVLQNLLYNLYRSWAENLVSTKTEKSRVTFILHEYLLSTNLCKEIIQNRPKCNVCMWHMCAGNTVWLKQLHCLKI